MKKEKETKELEEYLEAHASELIEVSGQDSVLIRHAKEDEKARKARAASLQKLRKDKLKLSQSELAKAVGANVRTLQSWETGRQAYPKSVEILMSLMNRLPGVKRELLTPIEKKENRAPIMKRKRRIATMKRAGASKKAKVN
jgi:DNA-binding transcriptional regulator YiaG